MDAEPWAEVRGCLRERDYFVFGCVRENIEPLGISGGEDDHDAHPGSLSVFWEDRTGVIYKLEETSAVCGDCAFAEPEVRFDYWLVCPAICLAGRCLKWI